MFAFPGTPDYLQRFGPPDDYAWERAHEHYLAAFREKGFSDQDLDRIMDPAKLTEPGLEAGAGSGG